MEVQLAYDKFSIKLNENFETSKIAVDRGRFVIIFNEATNKKIESILDNKQTDEYRYIQKLLVKNHEIGSPIKKQDLDLFALPKNYFDFSSAYSLATKGKCENKKISLFELKDDNSIEVLDDPFQKPSFIARESLFTFTEDFIAVYKEDFQNNKLILSYYRYPTQIRLLDPEDPESQFDENYPIEFDDKFTDRIITEAVAEALLNSSNPEFQIRKQQSINKL